MAVVSALPRAPEKAAVVETMFDRIAPRYDLLNRVLTFGLDTGWRKTAVESLALTRGARVLDLACGTGDLCDTLAGAGLSAVGADFSAGMLHAAHTRAPLVRADGERLPFADATFDGLTCGFALRNFASLRAVLDECGRVVRSGGRVALLDVGAPNGRAARAVHGFWFRRAVPFIGGLLSDRAAYAYLPASTAYLPPTLTLLDLVRDAGFVDVEHRALGFGAAQLIAGTRT